MLRAWRRISRSCISSALLLSAPPAPASPDPSDCGVSHVQVGEHPSLANVPWSREAQGITHDGTHWFLTTSGRLFRVPAVVDLGDASGTTAGAGILEAPIPAALRSVGFDHFGDLSWTSQEGEGLLCVPVEGGGRVAELAFFRSSDLGFLGSSPLPTAARSAPFCAVDGEGRLVVGQRDSADLLRLSVDWGAVTGGRAAALDSVAPLRLRDEHGALLALPHLQGAAFSEDGRRLYVIHGFYDDHVCAPWRRAFWSGSCAVDASLGGIHVFELPACRDDEPCDAVRVDRSTNPTAGARAAPAFTYAYRGTLRDAEEPEGITVWDLERRGAPLVPHVRGQVHALMLDNELVDGWDRLSIRHYRVETRCRPESLPASLR